MMSKIVGRAYKSFKGGVTGNSSFTGVGSNIETNLQPQFTRVNDRICAVKAYIIQKRKYKLIVVVAYVPTVLESVMLDFFFYQRIWYDNQYLKRKMQNNHKFLYRTICKEKSRAAERI